MPGIEPIDLRKLVDSKKPGMSGKIPGFVFDFLGRLICLDKINGFLAKYGDRYGIDYADGMMEYLDITFEVKGEENLPRPDERVIFAANHPFGGPDGIAMIAYLGRKYKSLKFPVNDFLMNLENLNDVFIPVNKHGAFSREAALVLENAYASSSQMLIFPAGLCSRKIKGKVRDLPWKKHFVCKAVEYRRNIVPIKIEGENSRLFYFIAGLRKFLHIHANLEMLLLPGETFGKTGRKISLVIGKPLAYTDLKAVSADPAKTAAWLHDLIYRM